MDKIVPIVMIGILLLGGICVVGVNTIKTTPENNPPDMPSIFGPSYITAGDEYIYGFETTDSDGDDVYYFVDWGDGSVTGWFGPYYSGTEAAAHHIYSKKGVYIIKAKAKDNFGAESDWATYIPQWRHESSQQVNQLFYNFIICYRIIIKENQ